MKPFYESWKASAHSDVACIECHYPPGLKHKLRGKMEGLVQVVNYVSNAYRKSKPWAEIPDESCLRPGCHETQLLNGEEEFKGVHFAHAPHLTELRRGKSLRCTSCHSQIVQGDHIVVTEGTCFICHFKENDDQFEDLGRCQLCHTDERMLKASREGQQKHDHTSAVIRKMDCQQCHSQTLTGDGAVPKEQCFNCHWENERLARYGDTDYLHTTHITDHKIECFQCHLPIQHEIGRPSMEILADCKTCHTGAHEAQIYLFTGRGGIGTHDVSNSMLESGMNCRGCHVYHSFDGKNTGSNENTYLARPESCEKCHGRGFGKLMLQWERTSEEKINRLVGFYQKVSDEIDRLGEKHNAEEALNSAMFNINLVRRGKSVHNMSYADALLNAAYRKLLEGLKIADSSLRLPPFEEIAAVIPSECAVCHVSLPVNDMAVLNTMFSHERHVINHDVKCQRCHSNARVHGELILTRKQCLECHHKEQKEEECRDCHQSAYTFYSGTTSLLDSPKPSLKFDAGIDCYACHAGIDGEIARPTASNCLYCHEEGYGEILTEWQQDITAKINLISDGIKAIDRVALSDRANIELQRIDSIIRTIQDDGSLGAHNYPVIETLLSEANDRWEQIKQNYFP